MALSGGVGNPNRRNSIKVDLSGNIRSQITNLQNEINKVIKSFDDASIEMEERFRDAIGKMKKEIDSIAKHSKKTEEEDLEIILNDFTNRYTEFIENRKNISKQATQEIIKGIKEVEQANEIATEKELENENKKQLAKKETLKLQGADEQNTINTSQTKEDIATNKFIENEKKKQAAIKETKRIKEEANTTLTSKTNQIANVIDNVKYDTKGYNFTPAQANEIKNSFSLFAATKLTQLAKQGNSHHKTGNEQFQELTKDFLKEIGYIYDDNDLEYTQGGLRKFTDGSIEAPLRKIKRNSEDTNELRKYLLSPTGVNVNSGITEDIMYHLSTPLNRLKRFHSPDSEMAQEWEDTILALGGEEFWKEAGGQFDKNKNPIRDVNVVENVRKLLLKQYFGALDSIGEKSSIFTPNGALAGNINKRLMDESNIFDFINLLDETYKNLGIEEANTKLPALPNVSSSFDINKLQNHQHTPIAQQAANKFKYKVGDIIDTFDIKKWYDDKSKAEGYVGVRYFDGAEILKETEKAVKVLLYGDYGDEKRWIPKSAIYTDEEKAQIAAQEEKRFEDGKDYYNYLLNTAKENGIKVRAKTKRQTIEDKLNEANVSYLSKKDYLNQPTEKAIEKAIEEQESLGKELSVDLNGKKYKFEEVSFSDLLNELEEGQATNKPLSEKVLDKTFETNISNQLNGTEQEIERKKIKFNEKAAKIAYSRGEINKAEYETAINYPKNSFTNDESIINLKDRINNWYKKVVELAPHIKNLTAEEVIEQDRQTQEQIKREWEQEKQERHIQLEEQNETEYQLPPELKKLIEETEKKAKEHMAKVIEEQQAKEQERKALEQAFDFNKIKEHENRLSESRSIIANTWKNYQEKQNTPKTFAEEVETKLQEVLANEDETMLKVKEIIGEEEYLDRLKNGISKDLLKSKINNETGDLTINGKKINLDEPIPSFIDIEEDSLRKQQRILREFEKEDAKNFNENGERIGWKNSVKIGDGAGKKKAIEEVIKENTLFDDILEKSKKAEEIMMGKRLKRWLDYSSEPKSKFNPQDMLEQERKIRVAESEKRALNIIKGNYSTTNNPLFDDILAKSEKADALRTERFYNQWRERSGLTARKPITDTNRFSLKAFIKDKFANARDFIGEKTAPFRDFIGDKTAPFRDYVSDKYSKVKDSLVEKYTEARDILSEKYKAVSEALGDKFNATKEFIGEKISPVKEALGSKIENIKKAFRTYSSAKDTIEEALRRFSLGNIKDNITEKLDQGKTQFKEVTERIKQFFQDYSGTFQEFIHNSISLTSKLLRDVKASFIDIGNNIRSLSSVMYSAIHLAQALENVMNISDSMTSIGARLDRYDTSNKTGNQLLNEVFSSANESRAGVEELGTLAQRILATGAVGGDATSALRIARLFSKSLVLGGSTQQESKSALLQLSQGLAANQLGGDELRALRENGIGLTEMLAKGLTKAYANGKLTDSSFANVSIGDLKDLGKKAKLTAPVIITAISEMEDEINKDFASMPELFSQTMAKLSNTFKKRLNEFNREGKGLSRIVNLFQQFEQWLDSEKGRKVLDDLMDMFDRFIKMLTDIASTIGGIAEKYSGLFKFVADKAMFMIPLMTAGSVLFGKTDVFGNERAGLLGYGGIVKIITRILQGGNPFLSLFGAETINGKNTVVGGLLTSFIPGIAEILTNGKASKEIFTLSMLQTFLQKGGSTNNPNTILEMLTDLGLDKNYVMDKLIESGATIGKDGNLVKKGGIGLASFARLLLGDGVLKHIEPEIDGREAMGGLVPGTTSTYSIVGAFKTMLSAAVANPIVMAIAGTTAAVVAATAVFKHFDKKRENEQYEEYLRGFHDYDKYNLTDEQIKQLEDEKKQWWDEHTSNHFLRYGVKKNYTDAEFDTFALEQDKAAARMYIANSEKQTELQNEIANNTKGLVEITAEFINNMKDIRTRSYRQDLLMNGNGNQTTWSITVNSNSADEIARAIQSKIVEANNKMVGVGVNG